MVINDAFTFANQVREYYLETKTTQYGELCPPFSIIKSTGPTRSIVYDFENHNALIEILSINSSDEQAIFNYISKFGWLFNEEDEVDHVNESFESAIDVNDAAAVILSLQSLVNLITSIQNKDFIGMITYVSTLLLSEIWPDDYYIESFSALFYEISRHLEYYGEDIPSSTNLKLNQIIDYMVGFSDDDKSESGFAQPKYDRCLSLLGFINKCFDINLIEQHNLGAFKTDVINNIDIFPCEAIDLLKSVCVYTIEAELNNALFYINPRIKISNTGKLTGGWNISDLYSALYLDIYLSYTSEKIFRKCANPTCNQYFEVDPGDTRKKYCSIRCAQLMAKRKQRERDKNKIKPDV